MSGVKTGPDFTDAAKAAAAVGTLAYNLAKGRAPAPVPMPARRNFGPVPKAVGPGMDNEEMIDLGLSRRTYACSMAVGRKKKPSIRQSINGLILKNHQLYQMLNFSQLNEAYRANGCFPLVTKYLTGSSSSDIATMVYPIYVFRLSAPCGEQQGGAVGGRELAYEYPIAPITGYRLYSSRTQLGGPIKYEWVELADTLADVTLPHWNVKPLALWSSATEDDTNCSQIVVDDGIPKTHRLCHQSSDCQILFTGAKNNSCDVKACVVSFSSPEFAPAQEGKYFGVTRSDPCIDGGLPLSVANGTTITYRPNSRTIGADEFADQNVLDSILSPWLHNRQGHPLSSYVTEPGMVRKKAWYESCAFSTTLSSLLNTTLDQNPVQYKHRLVYRPNKWVDVNNEPDNLRPHQATTDPRINPISTALSCGVFPRVESEKWLMVTGFTHNATKLSTASFSNTTDPSFDVSIRSTYLFPRGY